ncbi:MAG: hypothetical protein FWC20_00565 [Oscillospiraceae bacterium]|nr:hypothetical protein [Oscillospiraceae bacterium]MCL2277885.1 hypothetical protein [Oscillospiraceae bacterium]
MANISSAFGTMILEGDWSNEDVAGLNLISQNILFKWYYNIELDDFEESGGKYYASFIGTGRWVFAANLKSLDRWTKEDVRENKSLEASFVNLLKSMHSNNLEIHVTYTDEEGGCLELYEAKVVFTSDGSSLLYEEVNCTTYKYNLKNYVDVTGDVDMLDGLVISFCDKFGLSHDNGTSGDYDKVSDWITSNDKIMPHYWTFDELDEGIQQTFIKEFGGVAA